MKLFLGLIICTFSSLWAQDIVFGVVPQQSPLILSKKWIPVVQELSKLTGYNISFKTEPSIPQFEKKLYAGQYDIAYMNPYHYVVAHKQAGFEALARSKKDIQGIIVSNGSKTMTDLIDSKDQRFLFPAPRAFAATLLVKYELKDKYNINLDQEYDVRYVNSHDSVYKGVARNIGAYGGGIVRTYENMDDAQSKRKLNIIYLTQFYPSHPIAISNRLSPEVKQKLTKALLSLPASRLKDLNIPRLIPTNDAEYDDIKKLAIELGIYHDNVL